MGFKFNDDDRVFMQGHTEAGRVAAVARAETAEAALDAERKAHAETRLKLASERGAVAGYDVGIQYVLGVLSARPGVSLEAAARAMVNDRDAVVTERDAEKGRADALEARLREAETIVAAAQAYRAALTKAVELGTDDAALWATDQGVNQTLREMYAALASEKGGAK